MLRDVRLNLLPNVLNCISWSAGGDIALVASEDVIILIPKGGTRLEKSVQDFDHAKASVRERMIADIEKDIPPADGSLYSAGEEQGPGYAKEVAWSPLGMSEHRRCLLAVCTTNHKVYIFEPSGHPTDNWNPIHNLEDYTRQYAGWIDKNEDPIVRRLRERLKAVAWSWPCHQTWTPRWGESVVAVANDFAEIVLFRIAINAVDIFQVISLEARNKRSGKYAHCMTWSSWEDCGDQTARCFLAYTISGRVMVSKIRAKSGGLGSHPLTIAVEEPIVLGKAISEKHPIFAIAWSKDVIEGQMILAYGVQKRVSVLALDEHASITSTKDFTNEFIEPISGLQFTPSNTDNAVGVQVISSRGWFQVIDFIVSESATVGAISKTSTVHGQGDIEMADVPGSLEAEEFRVKMDRWPSMLSERKEDFIGEKDIISAEIRGYGLAVSSFGGVVAVCYSLHPSGTLQYITASKEKTVILFGNHEELGAVWKSLVFDTSNPHRPTLATLSSEALFLEARALGSDFIAACKKKLELEGDFDSRRQIQDATSLSMSNPTHPPIAFPLESPSLDALRYSFVLQLKQRGLNPPSKIPDNAEVIAAQVLSALQMPRNATSASSPLSKRIIYSLASIGVLGFSESQTILHLCKDAFTWLDEHTDETTDFSNELNIIERRMGGQGTTDKQFTSSLEKCVVCQAGMVWRDLKVAECAKGHRFSRCATTFLPIVRPDGTKECMVCGRTVLGKSELLQEADADGEENQSLATQVYRYWDICLQCGGHYWAQSGFSYPIR